MNEILINCIDVRRRALCGCTCAVSVRRACCVHITKHVAARRTPQPTSTMQTETKNFGNNNIYGNSYLIIAIGFYGLFNILQFISTSSDGTRSVHWQFGGDDIIGKVRIAYCNRTK